MPITRRFAAYALAFCLAGPALAQQGGAPVLVFAAASLQTALNAIAAEWQKETGKSAKFSFATSSALAKQIEQGAPADLFASADLEWMDYAATKGLIDPASRKSLLGNRLVLIAAKDDPLALTIAPGFDLAGTLGEGRLASGNPASTPAGHYARQALTNLGVWDKVSGRLAGTDNVRAALALVARGEAKLGIVYATDARAEPGVRVVGTFPEASHAPIVYPFARVKDSKNPEAEAFLRYLSGPAARKLFEAQGFAVLP